MLITRIATSNASVFVVPSLVQEEEDLWRYRSLYSCSYDVSQLSSVTLIFPQFQVEDSGFSNGFFPFIIAEKDVCSEVSELESIFEFSSNENADVNDIDRDQALEFLNELGWLLHRANIMSKQDEMDTPLATFNMWRFRNLGIFAMEREWCAVVKMLLDFLFVGLIDVGSRSPEEVVLSENLLHAAVRRKSIQMIRFLLRYKPNKNLRGTAQRYLFRPDAPGPSTITPLHIAAATNDAEDVLDVLTDDPGLVPSFSWNCALFPPPQVELILLIYNRSVAT
jgi:hypothetical protein